MDFIYAHSNESCCPKNFNQNRWQRGKEGETFREVQRGKRCSLDTNTEGAHPQSYLMTQADTEVSNQEQSLGQDDGTNPLVIRQIRTRDDPD